MKISSLLRVISAMFLLTFACGMATGAEPARVIRVGTMDIDNFFEITPDGMRGYGIAYLQEIAKHTGWCYEYVPGSWSDGIRRLENGSIDLLFPAEISEERLKKFIFSKESCCMDFVALYTRKNNNMLLYGDYNSYNGISVGMIRDNQLNEAFDEFLKHKGLEVRRIYYDEVEAMKSALDGGEVDGLVYGVMNEDPNQKLLAKIDYMRAYFMMSKNNTGLMHTLNEAMHAIYLDNPYFASRLYEAYYRDIDQQAMGFTAKEAAYIRDSEQITIACDTDKYPLSWYDRASGVIQGVYPDILRQIARESGLKFLFVPILPGRSAPDVFRNKDAVLLACAVDLGRLRFDPTMLFSRSYFDARFSLIGVRGQTFYANAPRTVAICENQPDVKRALLSLYPNWKIQTFDTVEKCIDAVTCGDVDVACINSLILQADPNVYIPPALTILFTASLVLPVSMAVSLEYADIIPILDKAILKLTENDIQQCIVQNTVNTQKSMTIASIIRYFPVMTMATASAFTGLILFFLFLFYRNKEQTRQNKVLEASYSRLRQVIHQREVLKTRSETDLLTGLYNKVAFRKIASKWLTGGGEKYTLIFFDLDNFKVLNDQYGHVVGDQALKAVASVLRRHFRRDDVIGRFGGDEFNVFMPSLSEVALMKKMSHVLADIAKCFPEVENLAVSAGIAMSPKHGVTVNELLTKADKALYRAKENGKNGVHIYNS